MEQAEGRGGERKYGGKNRGAVLVTGKKRGGLME